jgi:hypothetical protein
MWFSAAQQCSSTNRKIKENSNKTSEKPSNNPPKAESQYKPCSCKTTIKIKAKKLIFAFLFLYSMKIFKIKRFKISHIFKLFVIDFLKAF